MSQFIPTQEAITMTRRYRENISRILSPVFQNVLPLSETFDRSSFEALLSKPGCTGLRIYYGMDETFNVHALVVASDAQNADILSGTGDGDVIDKANRCPPICPDPSPLNLP